MKDYCDESPNININLVEDCPIFITKLNTQKVNGEALTISAKASSNYLNEMRSGTGAVVDIVPAYCIRSIK